MAGSAVWFGAKLAHPLDQGRLDHLQLVAGFSEGVEPSLLRLLQGVLQFRMSLLVAGEFTLQVARLSLRVFPALGLLGQ